MDKLYIKKQLKLLKVLVYKTKFNKFILGGAPLDKAINLLDLIKIIKKRFVLIISLTAVIVCITAVLSFYVLTPIYQVETQILVNQKVNNQQEVLIGVQNLETDLQLINTYNDIIKSPYILSIVIDNLKLNLTPEQLIEQITVANASNSQVINIKVTDKSPKKAVEIANNLAEVFKEKVPVLISVDNINILSSAKVSENPRPIKPNKLLNIVISAVVGFMLGMGVSVLLDIFDNTLKSEKEVEEILELPILGLVGFINQEKDMKLQLRASRRARGN